jgi:hypothetical protein
VAALAERWLQDYKQFAVAVDRGDPAVLRFIVDKVWDHLRGERSTPIDTTRLAEQIKENTPDTEVFDDLAAWKALQACVVLGLSLECCGSTENTAAELQELQAKLRQATVDAQASEAWGAWSAWRLLELGLVCCASGENTEPAEEAALVAYECVAGPGARNDLQIWRNQHRRPEIHKEVMAQFMLLTRLRAMPTLDDQSLETLRGRS